MSNEVDKNINKLNLNKNTGYTIPQDYFEEVEAAAFTKLSEDAFSKKIGFKTPDEYFNTIESDVLNKIKVNSKKGKVISLQQRLYKLAPIAVAATILLFFGIQFLNTTKDTADNLLATDIEDWFNDSIDFDSNTELALAFENDFDLTENDIIFNDDLIEDYFNNASDIDLLNEIE